MSIRPVAGSALLGTGILPRAGPFDRVGRRDLCSFQPGDIFLIRNRSFAGSAAAKTMVCNAIA